MNEKDLIALAQKGDKTAYRQLVEAAQDRLYGLVFSLVGSREQAEDLTQEIFVKAYFALPRFKGSAAFFTWLYRIATNHCLDFLRKNRLDAVSLDAPVGEDGDTTFGHTVEAPRADRPEADLEEPTEARLLLGRLPPETRLILTLRELEGYSYEEIAAILDCPLNTVKSRLNRAREALKNVYIEAFGNIPENQIVSESRGKS